MKFLSCERCFQLSSFRAELIETGATSLCWKALFGRGAASVRIMFISERALFHVLSGTESGRSPRVLDSFQVTRTFILQSVELFVYRTLVRGLICELPDLYNITSQFGDEKALAAKPAGPKSDSCYSQLVRLKERLA
jgi:hypothetical protein